MVRGVNRIFNLWSLFNIFSFVINCYFYVLSFIFWFQSVGINYKHWIFIWRKMRSTSKILLQMALIYIRVLWHFVPFLLSFFLFFLWKCLIFFQKYMTARDFWVDICHFFLLFPEFYDFIINLWIIPPSLCFKLFVWAILYIV